MQPPHRQAAKPRVSSNIGPDLIWIRAFGPRALIVVMVIAGVILRAIGVTRSLWLDEFGTLWVVEGSLVEAVRRTIAFQGQSPLYYVLTWPFPHFLGESELALRLPSLLSSMATALVAGKAAMLMGGRRSGVICGLSVWLSLPVVQASVNARAYALAMLAMAVMLYGFLAATLQGRRSARLAFVGGGTLLVLSHYVLALAIPAVAVAHLTQRQLRRRYSMGQFASDLAAVALLSALSLPQLVTLWERRHGLSWIQESQYGPIAGLLLPFLVGALITPREPFPEAHRVLRRALWTALVAQIVLVAAASGAGLHLLAARYLSVIVIPAAILAATTVARLSLRDALAPVLCFVGLNAFGYAYNYRTVGTFSGAGPEDWRQATSVLARLIDDDPSVLVLYRSGFVEQDAAPVVNSDVDQAPLRSPATAAPHCRVVPLTYRWTAPARSGYFDRTVAASIDGAPRFYVLSLAFAEPGVGSYVDRVRGWIAERWPGEFTARDVAAGRNIQLVSFERTISPVGRDHR